MKGSMSMFWHRVVHEKWLLLVCFILAFFAWQSIRRNIGFEIAEITVSDVAVDIDVPKDWAVWEQSAHRVNIVFRGSREDLSYLNNEQLRVVIPASKPKRGAEMVVKLSSAYLLNPTDAKVVSFSPSEIVVKLDEESQRLLPVKAVHEGALPDGLDIDHIVCTPLSVRVSGARKVLDEMDSIPTEPINLDSRQGPFKESVPVDLPQAGRMRVDPDWVSVEFFLNTHSSAKTFNNIPVRTMCAPGERRHIEIQPKSINITVSGQQQRIDQLKPEELFAYVGCYDLTDSTDYDLPVVVDLPAGLQSVQTEPAVVHVQIDNMK